MIVDNWYIISFTKGLKVVGGDSRSVARCYTCVCVHLNGFPQSI